MSIHLYSHGHCMRIPVPPPSSPIHDRISLTRCTHSNLLVLFICIFVMTNNVEHLHVLTCLCISFSVKYLFKSFALFELFSYHWVWRALHILWTQVLYQIHALQRFSLGLWFDFILFKSIFLKCRNFSFWWSSTYPFMDCAFWPYI